MRSDFDRKTNDNLSQYLQRHVAPEDPPPEAHAPRVVVAVVVAPVILSSNNALLHTHQGSYLLRHLNPQSSQEAFCGLVSLRDHDQYSRFGDEGKLLVNGPGKKSRMVIVI